MDVNSPINRLFELLFGSLIVKILWKIFAF